MQVAKTTLLCVVLVSVLQGCASHIVSAEHSAIRNELIGLHEEQIMDNLVRIHFGKMVMHMYYTEASATGVWELSAEASQGGTQVKTDNDGNGLLLSNDSDNFGIGGKAKRSSTMNLKGIPATDNPSLYQAYKEFAGSHLAYWSDDASHRQCQACDFDADPTSVLLSKTVELGDYFPDARGEMRFAICACSRQAYFDLIMRTALAGPGSAKKPAPKIDTPVQFYLKPEFVEQVSKQ